MKPFQCAICLEPHSPTTRKFAIHCGKLCSLPSQLVLSFNSPLTVQSPHVGHVFCGGCITGFVASKRGQRQPIICPSCRAPFTDRPPLLIELYLEYEDEDQPVASGSGSSANGVLISERDQQQMTEILEEIDSLGVESSGKDLEDVIAKGEMLSLRLQSAAADDAAKVTYFNAFFRFLY